MRAFGLTMVNQVLMHLPLAVLAVDELDMIRFCNYRAAELLDASSTSLIGESLGSVFGEENLIHLKNPYSDGSPMRVIVKNGSLVIRSVLKDVHVLQWSGYVVAFQDAGVYEETTGVLEVAQAANRELETILNSVYDDILITDGDGVILRASKSVETQYRVPMDELVGQSVFELERRHIFNPSVTAMVLREGGRQMVVQDTPDGSRVLITGVPVVNEAGELHRVVSYAHDVTELYKLKELTAEMSNEMERMRSELERLRSTDFTDGGLVASSPVMKSFLSTIHRVAQRDVPVLLLGESGVGKGAFAKWIHRVSHRAGQPFVEINCGAIPEALVESELFGYEDGAFTGALRSGRIGLLETAHRGTLFLDEIGDLPFSMQVKLLHAIQEREFLRVGGRKPVKSDFRLIAATNRPLEQMVQSRQFREDLYFRLNIVSLKIPPLRERKEDIVELSRFFVGQMSERHHLVRRLSSAVIERFLAHEWPGNVRELENIIERLVVLSTTSEITIEDLPAQFKEEAKREIRLGESSLTELLEEHERALLGEARLHVKTTQELADLLGVSQPTAVRKLHKYFPDDARLSK